MIKGKTSEDAVTNSFSNEGSCFSVFFTNYKNVNFTFR